MGERWQPPKHAESPYLPIDYYSESEEMRRRLDQEKERLWSRRKRRPVEHYAVAEYQGRMSDLHTKMCQLATTAYRSVGRRKIAIPFPGRLQGLPAPVLVESVEVVLKVQDPWQIAQNIIYLKVSYYNNTETIYPLSVNSQYEVSYNGAVIEPISTHLFEQVLECEDDIQQTLDAVKALGCKVGLTIKPGTRPEALLPYLDQLDLVLVMSVEPGFGGQKFMPSALDKLRWLKAEREARGLHFLLEVDGGVDRTTAPLCVEAGADILVAGSAVFGAADPAAAVQQLAAL